MFSAARRATSGAVSAWSLSARRCAGAVAGPVAACRSTAMSLTGMPATSLCGATGFGAVRGFAAAAGSSDFNIKKLRNIGISAHIDSGKTTLTERILFYTGRINEIHDVRGKDGVGAKMDSMELEREKGITIQSAATYCSWKDSHINIIDTPGHVDFTVEVERALRVLDGAVLVLCGVSGVQSQSITVDRQMKRYNVPRLAFINKLDRQGSNPFRVIQQLRDKLRLNAAAVQIPIGLENDHQGVVDVITGKAVVFEGDNGEKIIPVDVPADLKDLMQEKRLELIERLAEVDEEIGEMFLMEEEPTAEQLHTAIRKATINLDFVPVFLGSAYKNKGVQPLLDAVLDYLPNPEEVTNKALDRDNEEAEVIAQPDPELPLIALAFKLEESRFGQLTYLRVYQGSLKRGGQIFNIDNNREKIKVPRLVRLHSNELEDVDGAQAGEIIAMFGVDCHSGDTFTDGSNVAMTSMFCPEPVISYSVTVEKSNDLTKLSRALQRFQKEDPTFKVHVDPESNETIISGMGELHLDIYVERMRREYDITVKVGEPRVNYRETVTQKAEFNYLHKKQSGGSGQYGRVTGYVEPLDEGQFEFVNAIIGNAIPPEYINAVKKGFEEALDKGPQIGHRVQGLKVVLTDGQAHMVDSSELAFRLAAQYAFREVVPRAGPAILEPLMKVEVEVPDEFQSTCIGLLNQRKGQLQNSETRDGHTVVEAHVPLSQMFGFSTALRSGTQGKGEFTMEYKEHSQVPRDIADRLRKEFQEASGRT